MRHTNSKSTQEIATHKKTSNYTWP